MFWNRGKIRVKGLPELQQTYFVEPGEGHELLEATRILIPSESPDSDWDEMDSTAFKSRNPSFVRYKRLNVVMPTPAATPTRVSSSSTQDDNPSVTHSVCSGYPRTLKEKVSGSLSIGSYSFSLRNSLSSFLEQEGVGLYHEKVVDVGPVCDRQRERMSSCRSSCGMILAEPEGESVTFTFEPTLKDAERVEELEEEEEERRRRRRRRRRRWRRRWRRGRRRGMVMRH